MRAVTVIYTDTYTGLSSTYIFGAVIIEKDYISMYDAMDAVRKFLDEQMNATDVSFEGGQVFFTAGGAAPYRSSFHYKTITDALVL